MDIRLQQAIHKVFDDDDKIIKYFDPSKYIQNGRDAAFNVIDKIQELQKIVSKDSDVLNFKWEVNDCGYFVWLESPYKNFFEEENIGFKKMLFSFGVYKEKRKNHKIFEQIRSCLDNSFYVYLFDKNQRAINYLKKQGMFESRLKCDDGVIILKYNSIQ